ncbi:hypothetical protein KFL_009240010, partial [Klebsormidium nitens]
RTKRSFLSRLVSAIWRITESPEFSADHLLRLATKTRSVSGESGMTQKCSPHENRSDHEGQGSITTLALTSFSPTHPWISLWSQLFALYFSYRFFTVS